MTNYGILRDVTLKMAFLGQPVNGNGNKPTSKIQSECFHGRHVYCVPMAGYTFNPGGSHMISGSLYSTHHEKLGIF